MWRCSKMCGGRLALRCPVLLQSGLLFIKGNHSKLDLISHFSFLLILIKLKNGAHYVVKPYTWELNNWNKKIWKWNGPKYGTITLWINDIDKGLTGCSLDVTSLFTVHCWAILTSIQLKIVKRFILCWLSTIDCKSCLHCKKISLSFGVNHHTSYIERPKES